MIYQYGMRVRLKAIPELGEPSQYGTIVSDTALGHRNESYTVQLDGDEYDANPDEDGFVDDGLRDVPGDQLEPA